MIDLTPIDVRKKKGDFGRAIRGYDVAEVDLFLDLVADRMEELVTESRRLQERVGQLETQMKEYRDREQALTEAVVSAQELRDDLRRQATQEAETLRRQAEVEAERIRLEALQSREAEEDGLRRLRARRMQLLRTFRSFLERELAELAVIAESLEAMERVGEKLTGGGEEAEPVLETAAVGQDADGAAGSESEG